MSVHPARARVVAALALALAVAACACPRAPEASPPLAARSPVDAGTVARAPAFDARGLSFSVSTQDGRTRFRQGEPIVLRLAFASNRPRTYRLDAGTYDRSGRMQCDHYEWAPRQGAVDPLADWFAHGLGELGGLRTMPVLGPEPVVVERDLNEHVRFDAPGRYTLTVRTDRVDSDAGPVPLTAPPLTLEIVPADEPWAALQLAEAERALDAAGDTEASMAAARRLRFLTTPDATRAMARRLANAPEGAGVFALMLGVAGSAHRALADGILQEALVAPDAAIDGTVLGLLGYFEQARAPSADEGTWLEARRRVLGALAARLAAAFPDKRGPRARAVTFAALLEEGFSGGSQPPPWLAGLTSRLPEMLPTLPVDAQERLLAYRWRHVRSPALVPVLRTLATAAETSPSLRAHALRRLVELDPSAGRPLVVAEIRTVPLRLGPEWRVALTALPPGPIPGLDEDLGRGVERRDYELDLRAELLARHGSPALRPRIEAVLADRPGEMSSEALAALLGWLARLAPAGAAERLQAGLADPVQHTRFALAAPQVLVAAPAAAAVEAVVIALLDDPEPVLAIAAAEALGEAGSTRARTALQARLARWRTTWRPRVAELASTVAEESPHADEVRLEVALGAALARGRGWLASHDEVVRLRDEAVTDWSRQDLGAMVSSTEGPTALAVRFAEDGSIESRIGTAELSSLPALRARLALYPRGTRFRVDVQEGATAEELATLRRALQGVSTQPF